MLEENDRPAVLLTEIETDFGAEPFRRSLDKLPGHKAFRTKLEDLHVEAAIAEAELDHAARFAAALRVGRPPSRKPVDGRQSLVNGCRRRRFNSNLVQNVGHIGLSLVRKSGSALARQIGPVGRRLGVTRVAGFPWTR